MSPLRWFALRRLRLTLIELTSAEVHSPPSPKTHSPSLRSLDRGECVGRGRRSERITRPRARQRKGAARAPDTLPVARPTGVRLPSSLAVRHVANVLSCPSGCHEPRVHLNSWWTREHYPDPTCRRSSAPSAAQRRVQGRRCSGLHAARRLDGVGADVARYQRELETGLSFECSDAMGLGV